MEDSHHQEYTPQLLEDLLEKVLLLPGDTLLYQAEVDILLSEEHYPLDREWIRPQETGSL